MNDSRVFLIGTSAGGVTALHTILDSWPKDLNNTLVIIQHLSANMAIDVTKIYTSPAHERIVEIEDKMPVENNVVYFAPGGYHVLVEKDCTFSLSLDEPVNFSRPSIDVAFESFAAVYGPRVVAALLTGANGDGAQGLIAVRDAGGITVVQNPETAEYPTMPTAGLLALSTPDHVVNVQDLPELFQRLSTGGGAHG